MIGKKIVVSLPVLLFLIVFYACGSNTQYAELVIRGVEFKVEIADSREERRIGLMNRKELDVNKGMLFIFPEPDILSFWMKNTAIPLGIAFISDEGRITGIEEMEPFSTETVSSREEVRLALELHRDAFERYDIRPGDRIQFSDELKELLKKER
jgi:hypothetical protein